MSTILGRSITKGSSKFVKYIFKYVYKSFALIAPFDFYLKQYFNLYASASFPFLCQFRTLRHKWLLYVTYAFLCIVYCNEIQTLKFPKWRLNYGSWRIPWMVSRILSSNSTHDHPLYSSYRNPKSFQTVCSHHDDITNTEPIVIFCRIGKYERSIAHTSTLAYIPRHEWNNSGTRNYWLNRGIAYVYYYPFRMELYLLFSSIRLIFTNV